MGNDYDNKCIDLTLKHGRLMEMDCLRPWTDEQYENTKSPFELSGMYKMTFEDGAEVIVGSLYAYALAQGSFWFGSDMTGKVNSVVFVREDRALAYFAGLGAALKRDEEGGCDLPTDEEADEILYGENGFDVPFEALKYNSETAMKNMDNWVKRWRKCGLVKFDGDKNLVMT